VKNEPNKASGGSLPWWLLPWHYLLRCSSGQPPCSLKHAACQASHVSFVPVLPLLWLLPDLEAALRSNKLAIRRVSLVPLVPPCSLKHAACQASHVSLVPVLPLWLLPDLEAALRSNKLAIRRVSLVPLVSKPIYLHRSHPWQTVPCS